MSDKHYVHSPDTTKLEALLKQSKPWLERYTTALIYLVAAIMAVAAGIIWFGRQPSPGAESTRELMLAQTSEDYRDVADTYPDTEIAIRARLRQADMMLESAISNLYQNRKLGVEELESAEKAYESLANRSDLPSDVRQRVLVGLARIIESRCDGTDASVDAAVSAWKKILDEYKESKIFHSLAESRVKRLPQESTRSFYAWFQLQDPKPGDDLALPQDRPSTVPDIPDLSNLPGLDFETLIRQSINPAAPTGDSPASELDTTTPPATDTPTSDPPASDPDTDPAGKTDE